jgi:hypothetical protein
MHRSGFPKRWRGAGCAALLVVGLLGGTAATGQAAGAPDTPGCPLITAPELERVFDLPFEPQAPVGPSCLFLSAKGARPAIVTAFAEERSAAAIASGKRLLRKQPGALVLRGVGDLAILTAEPKTDPTGDTTLGLVVFQGKDFGTVGVTIAGVTPTTKQMRRLGKILAARL